MTQKPFKTLQEVIAFYRGEAFRYARMADEIEHVASGGSPATARAILTAAQPRNKGGRPKGFRLSDETRAKLRAAWRRRKAAAKKAGR